MPASALLLLHKSVPKDGGENNTKQEKVMQETSVRLVTGEQGTSVGRTHEEAGTSSQRWPELRMKGGLEWTYECVCVCVCVSVCVCE